MIQLGKYVIVCNRLDYNMAANDDILVINVGGEHVTVRRSTLCAVENSMLASMFSGRWTHTKDAHGNIFLDYDPYCFKKIVEFLRFYILDSTDPVPPQVTLEMMPAFDKLARFFGLDDVMWPVQFAPGANCCLTHNGLTVTRGTGGVACAALNQGVQKGKHCWRILSLSRNTVWYGIVRAESIAQADKMPHNFCTVKTTTDTTIEVTLDCDTAVLTVLACGPPCSIPVPNFDSSVPWFPCVVLRETGDSVCYISWTKLA